MTTIVRRSAAGSPKCSTKLVVYWAERMLQVLNREEAELSVLLTNDVGIQRLNRDYRDKDRPTDVLSFHFDLGGAPPSIEAEWLLGDIVVSLDTAQRQAESRHRPLEEELRWLLAHGLLHLVGYDHAAPEEKRVMVAMTRKLVRAAGDVPAHLAPSAASKRADPSARTRTSKLSRRPKPKASAPKPTNARAKSGKTGGAHTRSRRK